MNKIVIFGLICIFSRHIDALCTGEELKAVEAECVAANGGDGSMVESFLKMQKSKNKNDDCFRLCLLDHCGYFDDSGNLVQGNYKQYMQTLAFGDATMEKRLTDAFEACQKNKPDADKCTTAANFLQCVADNCKDCSFVLKRL